MNRLWGRRGVAGLVLLAFVVLGIAAVLPHTHTHRPEAAHACVMCRAQSAQPSVAPPAVPMPVLPRGADVVVLSEYSPVPRGLVLLPESRAPPAVA